MIERCFSGLIASAVDPNFEEGFEVILKEWRTAPNIVLTQPAHSRVDVLRKERVNLLFIPSFPAINYS